MVLKQGLLKEIGAKAGEILVGVKALNMGLIIRIDRDQKVDKSDNSRITGSFQLLSVGTGYYAAYMSGYENKRFSSAAELVNLIRGLQDPSQKRCTYILHRDLLGVEKS